MFKNVISLCSNFNINFCNSTFLYCSVFQLKHRISCKVVEKIYLVNFYVNLMILHINIRVRVSLQNC